MGKYNKDINQNLFDNPVMEFLSRSNAIAVIAIYYSISFLILILGILETSIPVISGLLTFLVAFLLFTLAEYLVHRYVYHSIQLKKMESWLYVVHEIHHTRPRDEKRLTLPLILAIIVGSILYLIFWLIMGQLVMFFFPGFLAGYASYLCVHFIIHTQNFKNPVFIYLWKHHSVHHFKDDEKAYGVSSPLWDFVFGTLPTKDQMTFK